MLDARGHEAMDTAPGLIASLLGEFSGSGRTGGAPRVQELTLSARRGSFQPGRTKWQV